MTEQPTIQITFGLSVSDVDKGDRLQFSKRVLAELRELEEVDRADRTEDIPEAGAKGWKTLVGFLTAEVSPPNLKEFATWMGDRFSDQPMKVKVKVGEQEVELEARSRIELQEVEQVAHRLLATLTENGKNNGITGSGV
jgi:hypothetical protein